MSWTILCELRPGSSSKLDAGYLDYGTKVPGRELPPKTALGPLLHRERGSGEPMENACNGDATHVLPPLSLRTHTNSKHLRVCVSAHGPAV